jgi:psiF repeat
MRTVLVALGVCALMAGSVGPVYAAGTQPSKMTAAQQDKAKACNTQANTKKLSGAARDSFVKKCVST